MIILGLDPGLRHTGWGIVQQQGNRLSYIASGTISAPTKVDLSDRLAFIYQELEKVLSLHQPECSAVEETFVTKNGQSTLKLGQARAVSLLVPALAGLSVSEYAPTLIKKSIVGTGRADKDQMAMMIKVLLPSAKLSSEHEADALAVAICHAHHHNSVKTMEGLVA